VTANLFDLPLGCHFGVGFSPSFGVWRELAAHAITTSWGLAGRHTCFPLLYHWRVLEGPGARVPLADELADVDRAVEYWHGSGAVRRRIEAIASSSASVALFVEHFPMTLPDWLAGRVAAGGDAADAAVTMVEQRLRDDVAAMNTAGLFHFDAHLDNILTDGSRLFLADFGLATSRRFELSAAEASFLAANRSHDSCHTITRLVDWLVTNVVGVADWLERNAFIRRCAEDRVPDGIPPHTAALIARYARIAVVINEFYAKLHLEDRTTPYPAEAVERAAAATGFQPWAPSRRPRRTPRGSA
jgi:hypothetical protein